MNKMHRSIFLLVTMVMFGCAADAHAATAVFYPILDGDAFKDDSTSWEATRLSAEAEYAEHTGTQSAINDYMGTGYGKEHYGLRRSFLVFDTSTIPSNARITNAELNVWVTIVEAGDNEKRFYVVSSSPASNSKISRSDYGAVGATSFGESTREYGTENYAPAKLNAAGMGHISKSGLTKFALRTNNDFHNLHPNKSPNFELGFYTVESPGTEHDPKLVVTYDVPEGSPLTDAPVPIEFDRPTTDFKPVGTDRHASNPVPMSSGDRYINMSTLTLLGLLNISDKVGLVTLIVMLCIGVALGIVISKIRMSASDRTLSFSLGSKDGHQSDDRGIRLGTIYTAALIIGNLLLVVPLLIMVAEGDVDPSQVTGTVLVAMPLLLALPVLGRRKRVDATYAQVVIGLSVALLICMALRSRTGIDLITSGLNIPLALLAFLNAERIQKSAWRRRWARRAGFTALAAVGLAVLGNLMFPNTLCFDRGAEWALFECERSTVPYQYSSSFPGNVNVMTPGGPVAISEIKIGDDVITYNQATRAKGVSRVTEKYEKETAELLLINGQLEVTAKHPFAVTVSDGVVWRKAEDLMPGDCLRSLENQCMEVDSVSRMVKSGTKVYNMHVSGDENYYVIMGGIPLLVHNKQV